MIQKKVCMVGAFATGKTSLVSRFVKSIFSEKYLTTVGVKIDKKPLRTGGKDVTLILWDLHGEDELQKIRTSYLRGSAGYILVVDGTRRATFEKALELQAQAQGVLGDVPFIVAMNKSDLQVDWEVTKAQLQPLFNAGWIVLNTSAKTGQGVEELFSILSQMMADKEKGIGKS